MLGTISAEAKEELKKAYIKAARAAKNKINVDSINHLANRYNSMREFAIACNLLTLQECEQVEYVGDNEMASARIQNPPKTFLTAQQREAQQREAQQREAQQRESVQNNLQCIENIASTATNFLYINSYITIPPTKLVKLPNSEIPSFYASLGYDPKKELVQNLREQLEDFLVEGLKRKGYRFKTNWDIKQFVTNHCRVCADAKTGDKIYLVKDRPFFYHKPDLTVTTETKDRSVVMTANNGSYSFL